MKDWLIFSLLSIIFWGISGFFMKLGTNYIDPKLGFFYQMLGGFLVSIFTALFLISNIFNLTSKLGFWYAFLAGLTGGIGTFFLLKAYEKGNLSIVTVLTALYPIVTILLAFFILKEKITLFQAIALVLSLIAIILLSI